MEGSLSEAGTSPPHNSDTHHVPVDRPKKKNSHNFINLKHQFMAHSAVCGTTAWLKSLTMFSGGLHLLHHHDTNLARLLAF